MKHIFISDFEKHGFKVDIIEHCENEETLCEIAKDGYLLKLYFDDDGKYVGLRDEIDDTIFFDEVADFKDLLEKLADKIKRASIAYKRRSILAKIVYDKLMEEIEK